MDEVIFRLAIFGFLCLFIGLKTHLTKKYVKTEESYIKYSKTMNLFFGFSIIGILVLPLVYITTDLLNAFNMNLSDFLRLLGCLGYSFTILFLWWILRTLGHNIAMDSENRNLVTSGPYKYIRHPLYSVFILITIFQLIISSNWLFSFAIPLCYLTMKLRVSIEEKLLIEEYGEDYKFYMKETGTFFPPLFK